MARKNFRATGGIDIDTATIPVTVIQETITSNSTTTVDSISLTSFVSAEYTVTLKQGSKIRTSKVIMQTDGTSVDMAEYGITETGGLLSGVVISATASGGNALLQITVTDAASTLVRYKLIRSISTKIGYIPDAPTIGTATGGYDLATVTFTAPTDDGGSAITTYTATSNPSFIAVNTATSPAEFTTLTPGVNYTFTITATNEFGTSIESSASNSVLVSSVPAQVTGLTATNVPSGRAFNNGRIDLSWVAPANNGQTITGYRIQRSTDNITYSTLVADTGTTGTTYSDTGLNSAQQYFYRVAAINIHGAGTNSAAANATATTVPQAPTIGTATGGNTTATVTYTEGATGGSAITTFTATSNPGSRTGTGTSPITITGLTNGTNYTFTVTATNANGTSAASAASNSVTPAGPAEIWTTVNSTQTAAFEWNGLEYGNGLWVAGTYGGGTSAHIVTSTDGITWTTRTSNFTSASNVSITSFSYGISGWLALGFRGSPFVPELRRSTDAITWVTITNPGLSNRQYASTYGNGIYVAGGYSNVVARSTNLVSWTTVSYSGEVPYHMTYGNGTFLAAGGNTSSASRRSTDGITWVTTNTLVPEARSVTYGNGIFVAGGYSGNIRTSTDAITWTTRNSNFGSTIVAGIGYGNGIYVAVGNAGTLRTSTDAITWTTVSSNFGSTAIRTVDYGNGIWIAAGRSGQMRRSLG